MKQVIKEIIKQVGINGLIAIKNDINRSGCTPLYIYLKRCYNESSADFIIYNTIFSHLIVIKDFAQYN